MSNTESHDTPRQQPAAKKLPPAYVTSDIIRRWSNIIEIVKTINAKHRIEAKT